MKKRILFTSALIAILVAVLAAIYFKDRSSTATEQKVAAEIPGQCGPYAEGVVNIGTTTIDVDISDTECKRELGLSGRTALADGSGMIFVFDFPGSYGFWMQQMNFSLDIVWVSADFHIVGIEKDLTPSTYPQVFGQNFTAEYVMELPAGYTDQKDITVGEKINFSAKTP